MTPLYCQSCGRQVFDGRSCKCRSRSAAPTPPFFSTAHCRTCGGKARWRRLQVDNGDHPPVISWECTGCLTLRYQYADVNNVETMCSTIMEENLRRTGANLDHDEALARLVLEAWRLYLGWKPDAGLNFQGYAFGILRRRANDIYRQMLGRNGEKPLANAISIQQLSSLHTSGTMRSETVERDAWDMFGSTDDALEEGTLMDATYAMVLGRVE